MINHALQPRDSDLKGMAFHDADSPDSLREDASFSKLRGILKATYEQLGGSEAFHQRELESWEK